MVVALAHGNGTILEEVVQKKKVLLWKQKKGIQMIRLQSP